MLILKRSISWLRAWTLGIALFCSSNSQAASSIHLLDSNWDRTADASIEFTSIASFTQANFTARVEYLPKLIQNFGVFGVGALLTTGDTAGGVRLVHMSGFGYGAYLRYQFKYQHRQLIVPYGGYSYERRNHNPTTGDFVWTNCHSPFVGLELFLNSLEHHSGKALYQDVGIKRTYLLAELRNTYSHNSEINIINYAVFLGLRFEI